MYSYRVLTLLTALSVTASCSFSISAYFGRFDQDYNPITYQSRELLAVSNGNRTTWQGDSISDRFCGLDADGNCHWVEYANAISKNAIAGGVLAVLSIIAFITFVVGRFVFNCFGGKRPSNGIVFPRDSNSFYGYNSRRVAILKILLAVVFVLIAVSAIIGFVGNRYIDDGVNKTADTIVDTSNQVATTAASIQTAFAQLSLTSSYTSEIASFVSSAQSFQTQANDASDEIRKYNTYRSPALIVSFALPLGLLVLAAISAIFRFKRLALLAAMLCFLCSLIIWISFGVHLIARVVISDVCKEVSYVISGDSTLASGAQVNALVSCLSNSSDFAVIESIAESALETSTSQACSAMSSLCSQTGVTCAVAYSGTSCTSDNLSTAKTTTTISDNGVTRTLAECATSCTSSDAKSLASSAVSSLDTYTEYHNIIEDQLFPLLNCSLIQSSYRDINDAVCTQMKDGVNLIIAGSCLLGAFLIPATILLIMGYKRFRHDKEYKQRTTELYEVYSQRNRAVTA